MISGSALTFSVLLLASKIIPDGIGAALGSGIFYLLGVLYEDNNESSNS
jgi:hypothetical protein